MSRMERDSIFFNITIVIGIAIVFLVFVVLGICYLKYISTPIEENARAKNMKNVIIVFATTLFVWFITYILSTRGDYIGYILFWISLGSILVFICLSAIVVRFTRAITYKWGRITLILILS